MTHPIVRTLPALCLAGALGVATIGLPTPAAAQAPDIVRSGLDLPVREVILDNGMRCPGRGHRPSPSSWNTRSAA